MLSCPRCNVALQTHTITTDAEAWKVEIEACVDSCGGLWIEDADFEADAQAKLLLDAELVGLNKPRKKAINTKAPADCPACRVAMHRFNWNNEGIFLDSCPMCKGRWIDGGEVNTIRDQWESEPVSDVQMGDLMRQVAAVKKDTEKNWKEENFGEWLLKRLLFSSSRDNK
jgi:Zn-finger nucleic acid-binding protein